MSKLIYITESQLNEIIGNGAYLNTQDNTNEYKLGGKEITVNGYTGNYEDGDVKFGSPTVTDKIANRMAKPRVRGLGGYVSRRSTVTESNQDLTGKQNTFQISDAEISKLRDRLTNYNGSENVAGIKRGKNIVDKKRISYDDAYRILDDMDKGNAGAMLDPDGTLRNELERKIKTGTDISRNGREAKMARGENVLKSAPKTGFKGGAHTPKGNNTIGVTYEN